MSKRLVLFFLLLLLMFGGASLQGVKPSKSLSVKEVEKEVTTDSLLIWMTNLKNKSQQLRNGGEIIPAVNKLSDAIQSRWREPSTIEEHEKLAWIYTNRAYLYYEEQGDFLAAKEDYLSALKQFGLCEPSDYLVARYVYQPLGNIYTRLGENEIAISMLDKFKRVCEENGEVEALMNAYNDIGRAYMNTGKLEKSIELFSKGIELDDTDNFNIGLIYSSKAEAEEKNEDFVNGRISAKKSILNLDRVIHSTNTLDYHHQAAKKYKIGVLTTLAKVIGNIEGKSKAHPFYEEALRLAVQIYPKNHRGRARAFVELGNSFSSIGQKVDALRSYQLGLQALVETDKLQYAFHNPSKTELSADVVLGEALSQKGIIAHALFEEKQDKSWLKIAVEAYLTYFDWIEIQRSEQFEFNSKLGTANEIHEIGELALKAIFDLYEVTNEQKWIDTAFVLMDQTKAIVLAEEHGFKDLADKNPKMRSLLKEQNGLKFQRSLFKTDIQEAEQDENISDATRLKKRLSELDQQSQLLDQEIRSLFPAYRTQTSSKLEGKVAVQLNDKLKSKHASILSYFVGDNKVFTIIGTPANLEMKQFEREELDNKTSTFLKELNGPNTSTPQLYSQAGKTLFDVLIGGSSKNLTSNWVVFPDGVLNSLPFEALVSNHSKNSKSFKNMAYVVRDHVIHYSPSAYFYAHERNGEKAKESFLGIAPVFKNSKEYDFLPKSLEELKVGASLFSGKELSEEMATKEQFFNNAEKYDILHISTHAGSNSYDKNDAWMVFSDSKSSDHRLVANELLKLDLPASLVVLNACETGRGTVLNGEGPMSLARGFLDAGSQSTVTNLWRVNHESNSMIMKSFYENLSETKSPSSSLNAAKVEYLSSGEIDEASAHPYFWSSAILVGTDVSVISPDSISMATWISIMLGSILVFGLGIFWFRKKRRSK